MSVRCQQLIDGEAIDPEWTIAPNDRATTDEDLLRLKAESAAAHDWDVEWLTETSFVARKVRWDPDQICERIFRIGS